MLKLSKAVASSVIILAFLMVSTRAYGVQQSRDLYFTIPSYVTLNSVDGNSGELPAFELSSYTTNCSDGADPTGPNNPMGVATGAESNAADENGWSAIHGDFDSNAVGFSCSYANAITLDYGNDDGASKFYIETGNDPSETVANFFNLYAGFAGQFASGVVNSKVTLYGGDTTDPDITANGLPETMAFAFFANLNFTVHGDEVQCNDVLFARQFTDSDSRMLKASSWGMTIAKQAIGLIIATVECVGTDGIDFYPLVKAVIKDVIKDAIKWIGYLLDEENTWWVTQIYVGGGDQTDSNNASFTSTPNTLQTNNPSSQHQTAIWCTCPGGCSYNGAQGYFMMVTNADDDDTFNADFVTYTGMSTD